MPRRLLSDVSDQVGWPIGVILQITVPRYPMFFSFKSLPPKKKNPATLLTRTALQGCHWRVLSFFCRQTSRMKKWLQHYRLWKVPLEATLGFCFLKKKSAGGLEIINKGQIPRTIRMSSYWNTLKNSGCSLLWCLVLHK